MANEDTGGPSKKRSEPHKNPLLITKVRIIDEGRKFEFTPDEYERNWASEPIKVKNPQDEITDFLIAGEWISREDYFRLYLKRAAPPVTRTTGTMHQFGQILLSERLLQVSKELANKYQVDLDTVLILGNLERSTFEPSKKSGKAPIKYEDEELSNKSNTEILEEHLLGQSCLTALQGIAETKGASIKDLINSFDNEEDNDSQIPDDIQFPSLKIAIARPDNESLLQSIIGTLRTKAIILGREEREHKEVEDNILVISTWHEVKQAYSDWCVHEGYPRLPFDKITEDVITAWCISANKVIAPELNEITAIHQNDYETTPRDYIETLDSDKTRSTLRAVLEEDTRVTHVTVDGYKISRAAYLLMYPDIRDVSIEGKEYKSVSKDNKAYQTIKKLLAHTPLTLQKSGKPNREEITLAAESLQVWIRGSVSQSTPQLLKQAHGTEAGPSSDQQITIESIPRPRKSPKQQEERREAFAKELLFHIKRGSKEVFLGGYGITDLPAAIGLLRNCEKLILKKNQIRNLVRSLCQLSKLKYLDLESNQLKDKLPKWFQTIGPKMQMLILVNNQLSSLPSQFLPWPQNYDIKGNPLDKVSELDNQNETIRREEGALKKFLAIFLDNSYAKALGLTVTEATLNSYQKEKDGVAFTAFSKQLNEEFSNLRRAKSAPKNIGDSYLVRMARLLKEIENEEMRKAVFDAAAETTRYKTARGRLREMETTIRDKKYEQQKLTITEVMAEVIIDFRIRKLGKIAVARSVATSKPKEKDKNNKDRVFGAIYCMGLSNDLKLLPYICHTPRLVEGIDEPQLNQAKSIIERLEESDIEGARKAAERNLEWGKNTLSEGDSLPHDLAYDISVVRWLASEFEKQFDEVAGKVDAKYKRIKTALNTEWDFDALDRLDPHFEERKNIKTGEEYRAAVENLDENKRNERINGYHALRVALIKDILPRVKDLVYNHLDHLYENDPLTKAMKPSIEIPPTVKPENTTHTDSLELKKLILADIESVDNLTKMGLDINKLRFINMTPQPNKGIGKIEGRYAGKAPSQNHLWTSIKDDSIIAVAQESDLPHHISNSIKTGKINRGDLCGFTLGQPTNDKNSAQTQIQRRRSQ